MAREYLFEVYQKQFIVKTNDIQHGVLKGFIAGAKWQQQQNNNLYSEQTVTEYAYYFEYCYAQRHMQTPLTPSEWFNKNKKK